MDAVRAGHPDVEFELVTVQTTGDVNMKPFSKASDQVDKLFHRRG